MTTEEKKVAYWKWVNQMVLLNDMVNMFLPKSLKSNFEAELPNTDDVETQYQFMLNSSYSSLQLHMCLTTHAVHKASMIGLIQSLMNLMRHHSTSGCQQSRQCHAQLDGRR